MVNNERTISSILAAGFLKEGILRDYYHKQGKFIDGFKKGASVTVLGKLSAKLNEKDGKSYMNLDVRVDDFTLPPKGAGGGATSKSTVDDDIPF